MISKYYINKEKLFRVIIYLMGLAGTCASTSLCLLSGLGLDAWNVFMARLSEITPLTFGQWTIIVQGSFWITASFINKKYELATVFPIVYKGMMLDIIRPLIFMIPFTEWQVPDEVVFAIGYLFLGITMGAYLSAGFSKMPIDALMVAIAKVIKKEISVARFLIEVVGFVSVFAIGGELGIGTIIFTFTCGKTFAFFKQFFDGEEKKNERKQLFEACN